MRPYQKEALEALANSRARGARALLSLPTGSGKTRVAVRYIRDYTRGNTVFWLAHLRELLLQAEECIKSELGSSRPLLWWDRDSKPCSEDIEPNSIILVQVQSTRTFEYCGPRPTTLIIDETHREAARTYRRFEARLKPDYKVGLTATPYRLDKRVLEYDEIAYQRTLLDLSNEGWLATPRYVKVLTNRKYHLKIQGDFRKSDLERIGNDKCRSDQVADHYVANKETYGKSIIFTPSVESSQVIAYSLRRAGISAMSLCGKDDITYRKSVLDSFKEGKLDVLTNVQLFTEGLDVPSVKSILMARPTTSKTLWLQMVGRGSRIAPPKNPPCKDEFFVVDFIDSILMYPLIAEEFSVDFLGAEPSEDLKRKRQEEEREADLRKRAKTKEEVTLVDSVSKKGRILDMLGYIKVTNLYKSNKEGKRVYRTYPLFRQELPIIRSMYAHILKAMGTPKLYSFIESSYDRGGHKTNLSKRSWIDLSWSLFNQARKRQGEKYEWPPVETRAYAPLPKERVDLSLIDTSEPHRSHEENIKEIVNSAKTPWGNAEFVSLSHSTVFITIKGQRGYFWTSVIPKIRKLVKEKLGISVGLKVVKAGR